MAANREASHEHSCVTWASKGGKGEQFLNKKSTATRGMTGKLACFDLSLVPNKSGILHCRDRTWRVRAVSSCTCLAFFFWFSVSKSATAKKKPDSDLWCVLEVPKKVQISTWVNQMRIWLMRLDFSLVCTLHCCRVGSKWANATECVSTTACSVSSGRFRQNYSDWGTIKPSQSHKAWAYGFFWFLCFVFLRSA